MRRRLLHSCGGGVEEASQVLSRDGDGGPRESCDPRRGLPPRLEDARQKHVLSSKDSASVAFPPLTGGACFGTETIDREALFFCSCHCIIIRSALTSCPRIPGQAECTRDAMQQAASTTSSEIPKAPRLRQHAGRSERERVSLLCTERRASLAASLLWKRRPTEASKIEGLNSHVDASCRVRSLSLFCDPV